MSHNLENVIQFTRYLEQQMFKQFMESDDNSTDQCTSEQTDDTIAPSTN